MDKIQKSIVLIGSLIVSLIVIFSITANKVFAIEYDIYTSKAHGIEFNIQGIGK